MTLQNGDHVKVTASALLPLGVIAQNVFYALLVSTNGGTQAQMLTDLEDWMTFIYEGYNGVIADVVSIITMDVAKQVLAGSQTPEGSRPLSVDGQSAAEMVSHGVAGQTNQLLLGGGRPSIKFWMGLNEAGVSNGELLPFDVAEIAQASVRVVTGPAGINPVGTWTPGIISGDTTQFKPFANVIIARTIPAYQRRRKPGVGI